MEHGQDDVEGVLARVNALHPNLEFTNETEEGGSIPFLDMLITRSDQRLHSIGIRNQLTQDCVCRTTLAHRRNLSETPWRA